MSKMKVHAIIGEGTAPGKVIAEGLRDGIGGTDCVSLVWTGKPNASQEVVLDYILEHEIAFQMFYEEGTTPPRVFRESEQGAVQKVRHANVAAVEAVRNGGKVFYMWDNDAPDDQVNFVFDHSEGALVLELTNGLAPISIDIDIPEPVEPEIAKEPEADEADSSFTKDELEIMTPFAVKRYGERLGAKAKTKSGIIAELFPDEDEAEEPVEEFQENLADNFPEPSNTGPFNTVGAVTHRSATLDGVIAAIDRLTEAVYASK